MSRDRETIPPWWKTAQLVWQSLVLIHGFTLDHRMWDDHVEAFAPGHRVIRLDLRGFGRSSMPTDPYSHVEDVKALLSYLEIRQAVVLGLSMGGGVALDFALAYPEYTRALILADSTWRGFSWSKQSAASTAWTARTFQPRYTRRVRGDIQTSRFQRYSDARGLRSTLLSLSLRVYGL